jgi:hypothetical protein
METILTSSSLSKPSASSVSAPTSSSCPPSRGTHSAIFLFEGEDEDVAFIYGADDDLLEASSSHELSVHEAEGAPQRPSNPHGRLVKEVQKRA